MLPFLRIIHSLPRNENFSIDLGKEYKNGNSIICCVQVSARRRSSSNRNERKGIRDAYLHTNWNLSEVKWRTRFQLNLLLFLTTPFPSKHM
jgi:hypothetical protein